jgi:hypothetical protein
MIIGHNNNDVKEKTDRQKDRKKERRTKGQKEKN